VVDSSAVVVGSFVGFCFQFVLVRIEVHIVVHFLVELSLLELLVGLSLLVDFLVEWNFPDFHEELKNRGFCCQSGGFQLELRLVQGFVLAIEFDVADHQMVNLVTDSGSGFPFVRLEIVSEFADA
jgi:hypothetical protein